MSIFCCASPVSEIIYASLAHETLNAYRVLSSRRPSESKNWSIRDAYRNFCVKMNAISRSRVQAPHYQSPSTFYEIWQPKVGRKSFRLYRSRRREEEELQWSKADRKIYSHRVWWWRIKRYFGAGGPAEIRAGVFDFSRTTLSCEMNGELSHLLRRRSDTISFPISWFVIRVQRDPV